MHIYIISPKPLDQCSIICITCRGSKVHSDAVPALKALTANCVVSRTWKGLRFYPACMLARKPAGFHRLIDFLAEDRRLEGQRLRTVLLVAPVTVLLAESISFMFKAAPFVLWVPQGGCRPGCDSEGDSRILVRK